LASPEPHCLVLAFGDSAVDLELRFWINDPRNGVHNVKSQVLMRVWQLYHRHGIEFPYPQRDLHLKTAVPMTIVRTSDHSIG
jgi:small-conductance mechanosensitive channel